MTQTELATALANERDRFLGFLRGQLGAADDAEDVLQDAYMKAVERADTIREGESTLAWFWRVLRNAVIDTYRHRGAHARAHDQLERWAAAEEPREPELRDAICRCVDGVLQTLKPEQSALVRRVDLEGMPVPDAARAEGITPNNAGVRLHRARAAVRERLQQTCGACAAHGCLDCGCKQPKL